MDDAAIFVSIEARFCSNSKLWQESATRSEAKRASQASRFIYGQVLSTRALLSAIHLRVGPGKGLRAASRNHPDFETAFDTKGLQPLLMRAMKQKNLKVEKYTFIACSPYAMGLKRKSYMPNFVVTTDCFTLTPVVA